MARRKKGELFTLSRFTNSSGSISWRVAGTWPPGNPVRRNFREKADAIEALAALEAEAAGAEDLQHLQRTILSTEQLSDAEAAIQSLGGARLSQVVGHYLNLEERAKAKDLSLDSAMEFVESRYRPELEEISVLNARTAFLGTRRGRSERTVQFYESCTRKLLHPDPNRLLHILRVSDLERILARLSNSNTRKAHRRAFSVFFNWAVRFHYCLENPCNRLDREPTELTTISILSLQEVKRLLQAAVEYRNGEMVPTVAIALFAGLRPSEIATLTPGDVDGSRVRVVGGKMRRKLQRVVPVPDNLSVWLESYPFAEVPPALAYRLKVLRKATEADNWVQDILRHTSISYQAMRDKNEGLTAFSNGTSGEMMDRHYRQVIEDPGDVKKFWAMTPKSLAKAKVKVTP